MRLEVDLPDAEEREWLLEELHRLCSVVGAKPLLTEPVLPVSRFFPDRWDGKEGGLERLARRVLQHAGLQRYGLEIALAGLPITSRDDAVAWFAGVEEGVLRFGVRSHIVEEPDVVAAVLAHEVAHAWRHVHGIPAGEDEETEEFLTDLTAVYLGFGVIVANVASRHRSSDSFDGDTARYQARHDRYGYLPMASLVFLLAVQLAVQGAGSRARRRVRSGLEANQAQVFDKAWRLARRDPPGLRRRLGLPTQPQVFERPVAAPLGREEGAVVGDPVVAPGTPFHFDNTGHPVFRVRRRRFGGALVSFLGGLGASFLLLSLITTWVVGTPRLWLALVLGLATGAFLSARFLRVHERCSACGANLLGIEGMCPGCGGTIRGSIRRENDRLAAEEELRENRPPGEDGNLDDPRGAGVS